MNQKLQSMLLVTAFTQQILSVPGQWECFTSMIIVIFISPGDTSEYRSSTTEKHLIAYESVNDQTYV